ncbi:hypothetical protein [Brucella cytisi]
MRVLAVEDDARIAESIGVAHAGAGLRVEHTAKVVWQNFQSV